MIVLGVGQLLVFEDLMDLIFGIVVLHLEELCDNVTVRSSTVGRTSRGEDKTHT